MIALLPLPRLAPSPSRGGLGRGWVVRVGHSPKKLSPQAVQALTDTGQRTDSNRQTSLKDLAMKAQTTKDVLASKLQRTLRCHATDAERKLWQGLRRRQLDGCKFRRQHPFERFIVDFVCLERRLVIELDGSQHLDNLASDAARDSFLEKAGFRTLRFWNDDVLRHTSAVLETIFAALRQTHPLPDPPLEGEGADHRPPPSRDH
jgi:very-short-patch-repair endonuclease